MPVEDEQPLLERLGAAEPARLRNSCERVPRARPVPNEPRSDDDSCSAAAGPAVDVDDASHSELVVDLVERRREHVGGRYGEVDDGDPDVADAGRQVLRVRLELTFLGEIEEERHALLQQCSHLLLRIPRRPGAGVAAGDQPTGLDDGRRAHDGEVCTPRPTSSEGTDLNRPLAAADSSDVARLDTPTDSLRDRALMLAAELDIDPGTWYVRVLEEGRAAGGDADLGALVRAYWELQRVTGRTDLRDEWRRLADTLWSEAQDR